MVWVLPAALLPTFKIKKKIIPYFASTPCNTLGGKSMNLSLLSPTMGKE